MDVINDEAVVRRYTSSEVVQLVCISKSTKSEWNVDQCMDCSEYLFKLTLRRFQHQQTDAMLRANLFLIMEQ